MNPWRERPSVRTEVGEPERRPRIDESDQEERRSPAVLLASGLGVADGSRRDSGRKIPPVRVPEEASPRVREDEPVLTCVRGTSERKPPARLTPVRDESGELPRERVTDGRVEGAAPLEDAKGFRRSVPADVRPLVGKRDCVGALRVASADDRPLAGKRDCVGALRAASAEGRAVGLGVDLWGRETRGALLRPENGVLRALGVAVEGAREREGTVTRVGLDGAEGREKRGVLRTTRGELGPEVREGGLATRLGVD